MHRVDGWVLQDENSSLLYRALVLALEHRIDSDESYTKRSVPSGRAGIALALLSNKL